MWVGIYDPIGQGESVIIIAIIVNNNIIIILSINSNNNNMSYEYLIYQATLTRNYHSKRVAISISIVICFTALLIINELNGLNEINELNELNELTS